MSIRVMLPTALAISALMVSPVLAQTGGATTAPSAPPGMATHAPAPPGAVAPPGAMAPPPGSAGGAMGSHGGITTEHASSSAEFITANGQVRASKIIGSDVYNDQNKKIGSVDELLMNKQHDVVSAVLSVGGFLGIDSKLVKVPYSQLHVTKDKIVMPSATKKDLTQMPTYSFSKES